MGQHESSKRGPRRVWERANVRRLHGESGRVRRVCRLLVGDSVVRRVAGVGALVVIAVVASGATSQATAHRSARPRFAATARAAAELAGTSGRRVEVTDMVTKTRDVWANPDGSLTAVLSDGPVREPDPNAPSGYAPIDATLEASRGGLRPTLTDAQMTFSSGGGGPLATLLAGSGSLSLSWPSNLPAPTVAGSTATYHDVAPGVDLVVQALATGFDERIVLTSRPQAPVSFRMPLSLSGVTADMSTAGRLRFERGTHMVADADPALMWGASVDRRTDEPLEQSVPAASIVQGSAGPELQITPSPAFLADPSVTYPVEIDPAPNVSVATDTYVDSAHTTGTFANNAELKTGDAGTSQVQRSLLSFDTSILSGTTVNSASLNLWETLSGSCTPTAVQVWSLASSWSSSTTWNTQPTTGAMWASGNTGVGFGGACPANWVQFSGGGSGSNTLTGLVQSWADGTATNRGLEVVAADETSTSAYKRFNSTDSGSNQPYLAVNYTTAVTAPTVSGGSAAWQNVAAIHFTASGSTTNGGATITGYNYRLSTDGGATWSGPSPATSAAEDVTAEGTTLIQFQAVDSTGNTSTWAPATPGAANTSEIDRSAPSPPGVSGGSLSWQDVVSATVFATGSADSGSGLDHYEYRTSTDGGGTWSSAASGASVTISAAGETLVEFRAVDAVGNASSWAPATNGADNTVRIDRDGPTITSSSDPDPAQGYESDSFAASWTAPAGIGALSGYAVVVDDDARTTPTSVTQTTNSISETSLLPGTHFLHVRAQAADGSWSSTATFPFTVLALVAPDPDTTSGSPITLQAPAPVGAHDVKFQFRLNDNNSWSDVPSTRVTDDQGNPGTYPLSRDPITGNTPAIKWNAAETSTSDPGVGDNDLTDYSGLLEIRASMTASDGSEIQTPDYLVNLDTTPPAPLAITLPDAENGDYLVGSSKAVTWTTIDSGSVDGYSVAVDTDPTSEPSASVNVSAATTSYAVSSSQRGTVYFHIRAEDDHGNWSATQTEGLTFADAVITDPADGATLDGSDPLNLSATVDTAGYVCWQYETPGMTGWADVPASDVTVGGVALSGWPSSVAANTPTEWDWTDYGDAPGVDGWPGDVDVRAIYYTSAVGSCADSSGNVINQLSTRYEPTSGNFAQRIAGPSGAQPYVMTSVPGGGTGIIYGIEDLGAGPHTCTADLSRANDDGSGQATLVPSTCNYEDELGAASLDGTVLAYGSDSQNTCDDSLELIDHATRSEHTVGGHLFGVAVSPDGNYVAYVTRACDAGSTNPHDSMTISYSSTSDWNPVVFQSVSANDSNTLAAPRFTGDSKEIMYDEVPWNTSCFDCVTLKVAGFGADAASLPAGVLYSGPSCSFSCGNGMEPTAVWDRNNQRLAIQTGADSLEVITTQNGPSDIINNVTANVTTTTLTGTDAPALEGDGSGFVLGAWSPDGTELLIDSYALGDQALIALNPNTAEAHRLVTNTDPTTWTLDPYEWTENPTDPNVLAEIYKPDLWFAPGERFHPTDADGLLGELDSNGSPAHAVAQWWSTPIPRTAVGHAFNAESQPGSSTELRESQNWHADSLQQGSVAWWADQLANAQTTPPTDASTLVTSAHEQYYFPTQIELDHTHTTGGDDYPADPALDGPIYYHISSGAEDTYIQYWFFYRFNDSWADGLNHLYCEGVGIALHVTCDQHQGDWEGVEVAIRPDGSIHWVGYSQHGSWFRYETTTGPNGLNNPAFASFAAPNGTHPKVYVAQGSHANYPYPCTLSECFNYYISTTHPIVAATGTEATHPGPGDGADAWTYNDVPECGSCLVNLDGSDVLDASWPAPWGLEPPKDASSDVLSDAPGGPDYPGAGHEAIFDDPADPSQLKLGDLTYQVEKDRQDSIQPCCTVIIY
jgi:hypothetical protein